MRLEELNGGTGLIIEKGDVLPKTCHICKAELNPFDFFWLETDKHFRCNKCKLKFNHNISDGEEVTNWHIIKVSVEKEVE